jgi:hypothetical protein
LLAVFFIGISKNSIFPLVRKSVETLNWRHKSFSAGKINRKWENWETSWNGLAFNQIIKWS